MSDQVGTVSLGLELVGGNDLTKQITAAAGAIGQQLTKSLQSTFGGFSLKGFAGNISATLKETTETAMEGIADGMEQSVAAVEGRLSKVIDTASQGLKKSIDDNRTAALSAIDEIAARLSGLKVPLFPASAPTTVAPTARAPKAKATPDSGAVKAEIEGLTAILDNVNAKIDIQQRKLAELKQAYAETFNEAGKNKLQEKIVNTEATLLRLTNTSDKTAKKIWELEDSLKNAGEAAALAEKPVGNLGQKLTQSNKPLKAAKGNLDKAAKAAAGAGKSMDSAGHGAGRMGNSFTRAFGRILKQVFVFAVLYKAIRGFNEYLGGSLKTNAQFAASLNAIQTNLAVAFQPIYEAILPALNAFMGALAKITAYIAAFISALFGKTYQQSYQAAKGIETAKKAMAGYGGAAKKAAKAAAGALAGFDQLNTLDFSKNDASDAAGAGGGSDGFEMQQPDMDITGIQEQMDTLAASVKSTFDRAWAGVKSGWDWTVSTFGPSFQAAWGEMSPTIDRWKEQFRKMFTDIMTLGEPLKNWIQTGLVPAWQRGIELAGHVLSGVIDICRQIMSSLWSAVFPIISKFVNEGLPMLTDFVMGAQDILRSLFDIVKQIFDDIWQGAVDPAMQLISHIIQDALDIIFGWWSEWGTKIVGGLKKALDGIKVLWSNLWNGFLKPFVDNMLNMLTQLWDNHLKGLVQEIGNFVGKLISASLEIYNEFILPLVNFLVKTLGPTFSNVFSLIGDIIGTALGVIADVAKGIIKALGGIIDFLMGAFTGDWKRAWEGIKTFFAGIGDGLVGIFKGAINLILDAFNFMIRQMNKVSFKLPDWVPGDMGGKEFGLKIPEIPKLAKGGLAYGPTLAMVGDNRGAAADPEVISPLSKLEGLLGAGQQPMIELLSLILDAIKNNDSKTILSINGTEIGRVVIEAINDITRRTGKSPLIS